MTGNIGIICLMSGCSFVIREEAAGQSQKLTLTLQKATLTGPRLSFMAGAEARPTDTIDFVRFVAAYV